LLSPVYSAVTECVATLSVEVEKVATLPLKAPVPKVVAPSLNVTVPLALPVPGDVTVNVAVNVTDCPETDGLGEPTSAIVVLALFTDCERAGEFVLGLKFESAPYSAVIECEPIAE